MVLATVGLALLAGVLSTLSPCVLPLVPLVLGAATAEHRMGPVALAAGLAVSFTAIGLFVAVIGFAIGLDSGVFRDLGAAVLVGVGLILLMPSLQLRLATAAGPVGNWAERRFGGGRKSGLPGQLSVGVLLGLVWAPCAGPTLGAASVLAAKGEDLGQVTLTMFAFGVGAALPLLVLGALSRETMLRLRSSLLATGTKGKIVLGAMLAALGLLILSGLDKTLEAAVVEMSPEWPTSLTTRF